MFNAGWEAGHKDAAASGDALREALSEAWQTHLSAEPDPSSGCFPVAHCINGIADRLALAAIPATSENALLRRWMDATEGGDPSLRLLWEETEAALAASPPLPEGLDVEQGRREAGIDVLNRLSAAVGEIADDPSLDGVMGLGFDVIKQLLDAEYTRLQPREGA
jgi:hypothetical protein